MSSFSSDFDQAAVAATIGAVRQAAQGVEDAYHESIAAAVLGFAAVLFLWGSKQIGDSMLPGVGMMSKKAVMGVLALLMLTTCVGLSAKLSSDVANTPHAPQTTKGLTYTSVSFFATAWMLLIAGMFAPTQHTAALAAASGVLTIVAASCTAAIAGEIAA